MSAITELAARVEAGSGADRELDADIALLACGYGSRVNTLLSCRGSDAKGKYAFTPEKTMQQCCDEYPDRKGDIAGHFFVPELTSSHDAIDVLRRENLPGSRMTLDQFGAHRYQVVIRPEGTRRWQYGDASDGRRAYLAAVLRAIAGGVER